MCVIHHKIAVLSFRMRNKSGGPVGLHADVSWSGQVEIAVIGTDRIKYGCQVKGRVVVKRIRRGLRRAIDFVNAMICRLDRMMLLVAVMAIDESTLYPH